MNTTTIKAQLITITGMSKSPYGYIEANVSVGNHVMEIRCEEDSNSDRSHRTLEQQVHPTHDRDVNMLAALQNAGVAVEWPFLQTLQDFYLSEIEHTKKVKEQQRAAEEAAERERTSRLQRTVNALFADRPSVVSATATRPDRIVVSDGTSEVRITQDVYRHSGRWVCDCTHRTCDWRTGRSYTRGDKKSSAKLEKLVDFAVSQLAIKTNRFEQERRAQIEAAMAQNKAERIKQSMTAAGYLRRGSSGDVWEKDNVQLWVDEDDKGRLIVTKKAVITNYDKPVLFPSFCEAK